MKTVLFLFTFFSSILYIQGDNEKGSSLLEDYAIAHKDIQLDSNVKNLTGYEDIEYVNDVCNCVPDVIATIDEWKSRVNAIPNSYKKEPSRVRIAINVSQPVIGEIVIIYRSFDKERYAYINILYDGNDRLTNKAKENLIRSYDLINLKHELISNMKCSL